MSDILKQLKWRYATKKFDPTRKLEAKKLDTLKHAFNLTATSYGLQPLKLIVISEQETKKSLVAHTMNQEQVRDASHVLVLCVEEKIDSSYIRSYFKKVQEVRDTPSEILHPFESFLVESFSEKPSEEIKTWMEKQAYLALGNLLTVCAMEEIDACPIEGFEPKKYDAFLELEKEGLRSVLVMAVGYRAEDDMFASLKKVRRGVDSVVIER